MGPGQETTRTQTLKVADLRCVPVRVHDLRLPDQFSEASQRLTDLYFNESQRLEVREVDGLTPFVTEEKSRNHSRFTLSGTYVTNEPSIHE